MEYYNLSYDDFSIESHLDGEGGGKIQSRRNNKKRNPKRKHEYDEDDEKQNNKKQKKIEFKNDKDLLKFIIDGESDSEESDSDDEGRECPNPLCDHVENSDIDYEDEPMIIKDVSDLIALGKTFHCKNRQEYFGINLRILCKLVSPLMELESLIGMKKVKENIVNQIVFFLQGLNQKDRCGNCVDCSYNLPCPTDLNDDMLHTVITGPPGVGKTELGKILGKVYKSMGILSTGNFHIAKRSDLVGKYLGHTAAKTQAFIDKCKGGVMFIDEAYSLGNKEKRDSFSKECIDTINQNLTERRDFLCIIAGYKKELEECFFAYNPGLARRFTYRYHIDGYKPEELMDIFLLKIRKEGWEIEFDPSEDDDAETLESKNNSRKRLIEFFKNNMNSFPHFGGDVETFFLNAKVCHGRRVLFKDTNLRKRISFEDVKSGFEMYLKNRKYKDEAKSISDQMMYI